MATHDLTTREYESKGGYAGLETNPGWQYRVFTGAELKTLKDGTAPADGDTFKIAQLPVGCVISKVRTIVTDADDTSILLDIGYTDGTNGAATTFETDVNLNATGVTDSSDDIIYIPNSSGYSLVPYLTITPADIASNLDDATEFIVGWFIELVEERISTALATPV